MSIPNSPKATRHLAPDESSSRLAQSTADSETELAWLRPYVSDKAFNFISANLGLVFVACAQFFFACMNITVKYFLSKTSISVSTLILVRMGITSICCIVALHVIRDPNPVLGPPEVRRWLVYRGLAGLVGLFSAYKSYTGLTVSDSTSIQFLTPTLTSILGFLVLGEKCSIREVVAGLASLGGVVLISRPPIIFGGTDEGEGLPPDESMPAVPNPNESTRMMGVFWALCSVCGSTAAYLMIRKLGRKAHALHTIGYFSYMCTVTTFFVTLFTIRDTTWVSSLRELFFILLIGIFGFVAQMLLTMGIQRERVGRAGIALYLSVFFAIILELLIFHTLPAFWSICGIAVILCSAYWVAKSKSENKTPPVDDPESQPFSRSPSPDPSANRATRTFRAVSYSAVPSDEQRVNGNGSLKAHKEPGPVRARSGTSDTLKSADRSE